MFLSGIELTKMFDSISTSLNYCFIQDNVLGSQSIFGHESWNIFNSWIRQSYSGNGISIKKSRNRGLRTTTQLSNSYSIFVVCKEQGRGITENKSFLFFTGKVNVFNDIIENLLYICGGHGIILSFVLSGINIRWFRAFFNNLFFFSSFC